MTTAMFRIRCTGCNRAFLVGEPLVEQVAHCPDCGLTLSIDPDARLSDAQVRKWARPNEILPSLWDRASERKRRLLHCAFCRVVWRRLTPFDRRVVETVERYADGLATQEELAVASILTGLEPTVAEQPAGMVGGWLNRYRALWSEAGPRPLVQEYVVPAVRNDRLHCSLASTPQDRRAQCIAIRDLFGHLFWRTTIDPLWLSWNDGAVPKLAEAIAGEQRWSDLPILADALTEAGCTDEILLEHCRKKKKHLRGCWVLDRILGRG